MLDNVQNFSKAITTTGHTSGQTSITLNTGQGAALPDPSVRQYNLTWHNLTDFPDPSDDPNVEIVRVTAKAGDVLTVLRGQEGTVATDKNIAGKTYQFLLTPTKKTIDDIEREIQRQRLNFGKTTGSANAYVLTLNPAVTQLNDGDIFRIRFNVTNTSNFPTLDVNGLGPKTMRRFDGTSLFNGALKATNNSEYLFTYNQASDTFDQIEKTTLTDIDLIKNVVDSAEDAGSANNIQLNTSAVSTGIDFDTVKNSIIRFVANATNTGATTVTVNFGASNPLVKQNGLPLEAGDIVAGDTVQIQKKADSGDWVLMSAGVPSQSAKKITNDELTDTATFSTSSGSFVTVTGMTKTFTASEAGDWMVFFSSSVEITGGGFVQAEFALFKNATILQHSRRFNGKIAGVRTSVHTQGKFSVVNGDIIDLRALTSGGTLNIYEKSLSFVKVA